MNLVINFAGTLVLVPATEAAPIVTALAHARVVEREGWQEDAPYKEKRDARISIAVVHPEQMQASTPVEQELRKDVEKYTQMWLKSYRDKDKAEKELKALRDKLAKAGIKFEEEPTAAPAADADIL